MAATSDEGIARVIDLANCIATAIGRKSEVRQFHDKEIAKRDARELERLREFYNAVEFIFVEKQTVRRGDPDNLILDRIRTALKEYSDLSTFDGQVFPVYRVGEKLGTTIYRDGDEKSGQPIGWIPNNPDLARVIVALLNWRRATVPTTAARP